MNWNKLESEAQLEEIRTLSEGQPVLIFKHSTRCPVSAAALNRLERSWNDTEVGGLKPYYLDLIANRSVSNKIAESFGVYHESPQALVIHKGKCVYNASHMGIAYYEIKQQAVTVS